MPSLTKKEIIAEIVKCGKDSSYFINNYAKISHPLKGLIPFKTYPYQDDVLNDFNDHRFVIVLKARQLGISTITAAYIVWLMLFYRDKNVLVIATKFQTAANLVKKVKNIMQNVPPWLRIADIKIDNRTSFVLTNGSEVKAASTSGDAGRSEALSLLVIDEAAHVDGLDELWTGLYPTLSTGGRCIALSTPNGIGNWFHQTWVDGETNPKTQWHNIKLHWTVHPERDQEWRDEQTQLLGEKGAAQECDCDFISSGHTVIDGSILQEFELKCTEPIERRGYDNGYWIWKYPDYSRDYVVIADVARGDGADFSTFHVIDVETIEQVAEYKGKLPPKDFGNMLISVASEWNNALLAIENANIGWAAIQPAIDRGYQNLFYTYKDDGYVDVDIQLRKGYDTKDKSKMVPGVSTTARTRPLMISALEMYMREGSPIIHSKRLIQELFVFIWENGKAQAQRGYNDDLVMAFAIGLWLRDTSLKLRQQGIELNKRALTQLQKTDSVIYTGNNRPKDIGWDWDNGYGNEDLTWLIK